MMSASEVYRQKADLLLRLSAEAHDVKTRAYLLDEALYWHRQASDAAGVEPASFSEEEAKASEAQS
jgi:hypothetical protein